MANASIEISWVEFAGSVDTLVYGKCIRQELLAISTTTAAQNTAFASSEMAASSGKAIVRICTDNIACYAAVGISPDPTAMSATAISSARRYIPASAEMVFPISDGEKVAVKAA